MTGAPLGRPLDRSLPDERQGGEGGRRVSMRRCRHRSRCRCRGRSPVIPVSPSVTTSPSGPLSTSWNGSGRLPGSAPNGARLHPDTQGLTVAAFRQTTSRADDPQLHTHVVISAKVQTDDGRWLALDARCPERASAGVGRLVSVGAARRTHPPLRRRVRGDRERSGRDRRCPARVVGAVLETHRRSRSQPSAGKLDEFYAREGRDPTRFERAALEREAAADTRAHKTGNGVPDLRTRWLTEAADLGVTPDSLVASITAAERRRCPSRR